MRSCAGAARFGNTTETEGTDVCAATAPNFASLCIRDRITKNNTPPAMSTMITTTSDLAREATGGLGRGEKFAPGSLIFSLASVSAILVTIVSISWYYMLVFEPQAPVVLYAEESRNNVKCSKLLEGLVSITT